MTDPKTIIEPESEASTYIAEPLFSIFVAIPKPWILSDGFGVDVWSIVLGLNGDVLFLSSGRLGRSLDLYSDHLFTLSRCADPSS